MATTDVTPRPRRAAPRVLLLAAGAFVLLALWSSEPARADAVESVPLDDAVAPTLSAVEGVSDRTAPVDAAAEGAARVVAAAERAAREVAAAPQGTLDELAAAVGAVVESVPAVVDRAAGAVERAADAERPGRRPSSPGPERAPRRRESHPVAPAPGRPLLPRVPGDAGEAGGLVVPAAGVATSVHDERPFEGTNDPAAPVALPPVGSLDPPERPVPGVPVWPLLLVPPLAGFTAASGARPHRRARAVPSLPG